MQRFRFKARKKLKLTDRMKHYNFWVALSMAFLLLLNTLARAFHIEIDNVLYNDIVMAVLGVVTVLGFVQKDGYEFIDQSKNTDSGTGENATTQRGEQKINDQSEIDLNKAELNNVKLSKGELSQTESNKINKDETKLNETEQNALKN